MKPQTMRTKLKVTTGYLLLISLLTYAVYFISQEMEVLVEPDTYEAELNVKRKLMNNILAQLYQAEVIGQSVSTGRLSDYSAYRKAMRKALASIDTLRARTNDSLQWQRLDSISVLLLRKEQNMLWLLEAVNDTTVDAAYRQQVNLIIEQKDSVVHCERVQTKVKVHQNSYQVQKKRKGFFKRLAEAFAPGKVDTATVTHTAHEYVTDTLTQDYNPGDTVAGILRSIQLELVDKQQKRSDMLRMRSNRLRAGSRVLAEKINRQFRDFEREEEMRAQAKMQQLTCIRHESIRMVGGLAIGSVVLAVVFLTFIWRDITRSNRYRRELEEAKLRAEKLLLARERLMLTITHDLKAPAGSVIGYADLLDHLLLNGRQREYLNSIKMSARHLLKLVNALLDYYKLDSNKMEVNRISFRPGQLFDEIYTCFESLASQKGLSFRMEVAACLRSTSFVGAPFGIRQIVDNLLSNAIKFTEKGEVALHASYENGRLQLVVSDTGKGIPEDEQERMFQEFTRLRNAQGEDGFGLGLSIVQKWVNLFKGEMKVYSREGGGTRFLLRLPLFPVAGGTVSDADNLEESKQSHSLPIASLDGLRVLLIDDDRLQLELTQAMLRQLRADPVGTEHPELLLRMIQETQFDVLLTDVQMPEMDGFRLLEEVRACENTHIPLVAVTARADLMESDFTSRGFAACLYKPFTLSELHRILLRVTGHGREADEMDVPEEMQVGDNQTLKLEALIVFSGDDKKAAAEILHTFVEEMRVGLKSMQQAVDRQDASSITALAHKLLPLQRMIQAQACVVPLQWLEARRQDSFSEEMKQHANEAIAGLQHVLQEVVRQVDEC